MTNIFKLGGAALLAAAFVAGCGGSGPPAPTTGVAAGTVLTINATTGAAVAQALSGTALTFSSGIPALGVTGPSTLTVSAPSSGAKPTFSISSTGGSAFGDLGFGSCIFTVTASTIASLPAGTTQTITDCGITFVATTPAAGTVAPTQISFRVGGTTSSAGTISVSVAPTGVITLVTPSGSTVTVPGTTTLATITGS